MYSVFSTIAGAARDVVSWLKCATKQLFVPKRLIIPLAIIGIVVLVIGKSSLFHPLAITQSDTSPKIAGVASNQPTQSNPVFASSPSWSQDFTNKSVTSLDPKYWNALVGPAENSNKEQQYYSADSQHLRVENGALRLIGTHQAEPGGYQYGSARIETQGKREFKYGRIDVTAKLPAGSGTWPAVWLLPANDTYEQQSPATDPERYRNGGELDILESVGFQPNVVYGVAHTASDLTEHADGTGSYAKATVPTSSSDFNTYTILWTPTTMTFEVNGTPYYTYSRPTNANYKVWPFDQPFYLIANLALGGNWGGEDTAHFPGNGIDNSALPSSLDIRSIYYYPYVGS